MHMKKIFIIGAFLMAGAFSCQKLEEININPNNVSETHPQYLLTTIEWNAFQVEGADPLFASRMIVQSDMEHPMQFYTWDRGDFSAYNELRNVTKMEQEAKRIEAVNYQALAKFFRAWYFYNLTLTFGDVPYSEALKGEFDKVYTPVYDQQKEVFKGILTELEEANNIITDDLIPGDIIYHGDPLKWKKLINAFRLRVLLTLSKKENEPDLNIKSRFASIVSSGPLMESVNDDAKLVFINQVGNRYTEFNNSSYGSNRYMDSTFVRRLQDRKDPRLFIYAAQTKNAKEAGLPIDDFTGYDGGNPIAPYNEVNLKAIAGNVSKVNLRYTTDPVCEPHILLGYSELQFILAEARIRGWITGTDAAELYENGVKASFQFYNAYAKGYESYFTEQAAEEYLQEPLVEFSGSLTNEEKIERIITQKYLFSFLQGGWRMYFEHLRTGYPSFASLPGQTPPTRFMYPEGEYQYNSENVAAAITRQFGEGRDNTREIPWWLKNN